MNANLSLRRLLVVSGAFALLVLLTGELHSRKPALPIPPPKHLVAQPARTEARPGKTLPVGEEVRTRAGERRRVVLEKGAVLYVNQQTRLKRLDTWRLRLDSGEVCLDLGRRNKQEVILQAPRREIVARAGACVGVQAGTEGDSVLVAHGEAEVKGGGQVIRTGQRMPAGERRLVPAPRASFALAWAHDLMAQNESRLVPASEHAGGRLVAQDPDSGHTSLRLRRYHVDVHVEDGFARTVIDQTYFNDSNARLEGTFYFPLPADASLSQLVMYVEGQRRDGSMVERDRARAVYEQIVYQQKDPALLEWVDGSTFKMRVFPLEPRQEKRIILGYTQRLPSLYGQVGYRFPTGHTLQSVRDWSFHMRIKDGSRMTWSSLSHPGLRQTIEGNDLLLDLAAKDVSLEGGDVTAELREPARPENGSTRLAVMEQDGARYLLVKTRPQLPAVAAPGRRDWVFLFEASGDRDPLLARTQIEIVRGLLGSAGPDDTFLILTAGTRVRALTDQPQSITEENVASALALLEQTHLIGALDLEHALEQAGQRLRSAKNPCFVHVGSAIAALGERRNDELAKRLPQGAPYVGVGVGKRWNRGLMKAAAERSGGYFTQINPDEGISWRTFELAATLNTPRLLNVDVIDPDGKVTFLPEARLAAQGEEIAAIARIEGKDNLPSALLLRGSLNGQPFEQRLAVGDVPRGAGYLPREWARLEIERLLAEDAGKHRQRIIELSKAMTVVTPFTSLLLLESDEMEKQYKVEHGRKDHWAAYPCPERIEVVYEPEDGPPGNPKKGVKPAPRQVTKTILTRPAAEVMQQPGEKEEDKMASGAGTAVNLFVGSRQLALDLQVEKSHVPFPDENGSSSRFGIWNGASVMTESIIRQRAGNNLGVGGGVVGFGGGQVGQLGQHGDNPSNILNKAIRQPSDWGLGYNPIGGTPLDQTAEPGKAEAPFVTQRAELLREAPVRDRAEPSWESLLDDSSPPSLLYQRPSCRKDDRVFFDLVSYAPGMNTSRADVLAVLEAEAAPSAVNKLGAIDAAARALFEKARPAVWRTCTLPAEAGSGELTFSFDGRDRYVWQRTLASGLREHVVCDGKTLWHLYPDIGLGAERTLSRFHRLQLAALTPGFLPRPEDLARGADLRMLGKDRVALVPHTSKKGRSQRRLVFVFGKDGQLTEQQLVQLPEEKILQREIYEPDGKVRLLDDKGKEIHVLARTIHRCEQTPQLDPDLRRLVILPLPYRTSEHVIQARRLEKIAPDRLRFEDGRAVLASRFAANQGDEASKLCQACFFQREQYDLGLYVLLAACGQNLDGEHLDVLAHHPGEPLAQYLALYSSPVLRKHASQWAVRSSPWKGFLDLLANAHALLQRWESGRPLASKEAQQRSDLTVARHYVQDNPASPFSLALLTRIQDRLQEEEGKDPPSPALYLDLARAWRQLEKTPDMEKLASYERARCLWKGGDKETARCLFLAYYDAAAGADELPAIDGDFRAALVHAKDRPWPVLMRETARRRLAQKQRLEVLALALQCWQVDDAVLSDHLLALALEGVGTGPKDRAVRHAALDVLARTGQLTAAQKLLDSLLEDAPAKERAVLWRLAARLAHRHNLPAREMECLEHALDIEYEHLPDVINLQGVREDYAELLKHYQKLAESLAALRLEPPTDFRDKVVRSADRWRALDRDNPASCQQAAAVLRALGERELTWDYLTTPVGLQPNESKTWRELAESLQTQGELQLADRAYTAACAAEPTDARLLWEHAQSLRQAGRIEEARRLYRRIAEGSWQPRFQDVQEQAREQLRFD